MWSLVSQCTVWLQEIESPNQERLNEMNPTRDVESGGGNNGSNNNGGDGGGGGGGGDNEEEEKEQPVLTVTAELLTLLAISVIVAMASECGAGAAFARWAPREHRG